MTDDTKIMLFKIEYLKKLLKKSLRVSSTAHEILFKDSFDKQNQLIAATYLNKAISLISEAKAIYISNIEQLERSEVKEIFHCFDVFESEFLNNLSTNHSHQWTDIEFVKFKESIENFIQ